jgi:hypothetical protein
VRQPEPTSNTAQPHVVSPENTRIKKLRSSEKTLPTLIKESHFGTKYRTLPPKEKDQ